MEILNNNNRKSSVWRIVSIFGVLVALTAVFYVNQLFGNSNLNGTSDLDEVKTLKQNELIRFTTQKEKYKTEMDSLKSLIKSGLKEEGGKKDESKFEGILKEIEKLEGKIELRSGSIDQKEFDLEELVTELNTCQNSK